MKILYVASNPEDASYLNLVQDITKLQVQLSGIGERINVIFQPDIPVGSLPILLHHEEPDIVHLVAHGETGALTLKNESGDPIRVTSEILGKFMSDSRPPRLAYVNACNSQEIARGLLPRVDMAIGSTALISNRAARDAAIAFYDRIFAGASVGRAFEVCQAMMECSAIGKASMTLHTNGGIDASRVVLFTSTTLIAEFPGGVPTKAQGQYAVRLGLIGCPSAVRQVVFITHDDSFLKKGNSLEDALCHVVRGYPVRGAIWFDDDDTWQVSGDFRAFALALGDEGGPIAVSSMLCDALEARYRARGSSACPPVVAAAIAELRAQDGSGLT